MIVILPPKPAIVAAIAAQRVAEVAIRIEALLVTRGYVVGEGGIQIYGDGSVTVDTDRNPTADWAAFDPATPTAVETDETVKREQIRSLLNAIENGTAGEALAALRIVVPWLVRRELRETGDSS